MTDKPDAGEAARRDAEAFVEMEAKYPNGEGTAGRKVANICQALLSSSKRIEELEKALARLGSSEAMTIPFAIPDTQCGDELKARIEYARAALSPSGGGEMAQPITASRSPASDRSAK